MMNRLISSLFFITSLIAQADLDFARFEQRNQPMPATGAFAGLEMQYDSKRTLIALTAQEKEELGLAPTDLVVANFWHGQSYYIAQIKGVKVDPQSQEVLEASSLVQNIKYVKEHWSGKTKPETKEVEVHSLLLLTLNKPLQLLANQDRELILKNPISIKEMVISVEALRAQTQKSAEFLKYAFGPHMGVAHLIYSWEKRLDIKASEPETEYTYYPLVFDQTKSKNPLLDEKSAILLKGIQNSLTIGRKDTYNAFTYNCTNKLFQLIDDALLTKFDKTPVISEIKVFVKKDLPGLLSYARKMADAKGEYVPQMVQENFSKMIESSLNDLVQNHDPTVDELNAISSMPMFVEGHLQARELLAK